MRKTGQDYYLGQQDRLLKEFDRVIQYVKEPIILRYGSDASDNLGLAAREKFRQLLPELPFVGGEKPFTQFVISSGWFLALYQAMKDQGAGIGEIGELSYLLSQIYLKRVPGFARRVLGYMSFSPRYLRKLRQRADESHKHPYPRGYVYSFVEGDGLSFDYGVDYHQCATWTLYQEQGAQELTPYLCACDYLYSRMLGWGLTRTTTLGEGGKLCDFRFKRGGPTRIASSVMNLES